VGMSSIFIVITAVLGSLLEIIDTSIVAVAQPRMQGNLGVTLDEISWVSTGYIISNAVVLPIASWLANRIGRRTYFVGCITIFTITSMLCGLAPNFGFLIAARVIQGAAGGALLPTSQTLIQEQFPGKKAGVGSAIYGMSVMIGPALGPTLGGYLTDNYSWRSIFYINLPIGILAAVMALIFIPSEKKDQKKEKGKADWVGFLLLIAGIGCLQFVLERGQQDDWFNSNLILAASFVMAISLPLFYVYEYRQKKPIVDVKLFAESPIRSGTMLMAAVGLVLYSLVFIVPVFTDRQLGMDATHTGYLYIPGSIATMLVMPLVGKFLQKLGVKFFVSVGGILICGCLWMFSNFTSIVGTSDLFWPLLLRGIGLGFLFVPINAAVLSQYEGEQLGQAAGLLNLFRQIGGSVGIAGMSTFLDRYSAQYKNNLRAHVNYGNPAAVESIEKTTQSLNSKLNLWHGLSPGSIGLQKAQTAGIGAIEGRMESQIFQLAFNRLMLLVLAIYVLSIFPLWRMKLRKKVGAVQAH
jgi:DHA2 family multidrug resistance protein